MTELAARVVEEQRQAELIKALSEQIVDLQTQLAEYQEIAWLFEQLEQSLLAEQSLVMIDRCDGDVWLDVDGQLGIAPTLREAAMLAFEKASPNSS